MISKTSTKQKGKAIVKIFSLMSGIAIVALLFIGCTDMADNEIEEGLVIHFAEVHTEDMPVVVTGAPDSGSAGGGSVVSSASLVTSKAPSFGIRAAGGYDSINLEHHNILDGFSHLISLYRAYVVIDDIELVPCAEITQIPRMIFESLIGTAHAHAGHGAEPVGGRSLDKANVIDIVTQDEYYLALGDLSLPPGNYCAVRIRFGRFNGDGYGKPDPVAASSDDPTTVPDIPDMNGKMFAIRADYCSTDDGFGGCLASTKIIIDDDGLMLPDTRTIEFASPVSISSSIREAYIAVGIAYGTWMEGVDATLLNTSAIERQILMDNIGNSIYIFGKGFGELPPNI